MNILFDLDGTLTDPKVGIVNSIQFALKRLEIAIPNKLEWCIGPPLQDSLFEIIKDEKKTELAIDLYRMRFKEIGMFENQLYEGVPEVLFEFREKGHELFLATSKPLVFATKILEHFDLSRFFTSEYGSELDGTRKDKGELIEFILKKEKLDPSDTIMVGDRMHDLRGAKSTQC